MQKTTTQTEDRTLFDVADDETSVELIPAEEATAPLRVVPSSEPMMMSLARVADGVQIVQRAADVIRAIREAALRITAPADWVAMKPRGGGEDSAFCMLTASGAQKVAMFFQIRIDPAEPTDGQGSFAPKIERGDEGELQLHGWVTAYCGLTGEPIRVAGSRSSTEDFTGRTQRNTGASPLVEKADLARSLDTLLRTSAVRKLSGLNKVSFQELADAGVKVDAIPRGSGFGTSTERGASAVTSDEVKGEQEKLRDEILRRAQGDEGTAKDILKDITLWKGKDGKERWATSTSQLTRDFQVKKAWDALKAHSVFGDKAQGGNGGGA